MLGRPAFALLAFVALFTAGCVELPLGRIEDDAAQARLGFLTADHALAEGEPDADGRVPLGGFYRRWATGEDYPTWASARVAQDMLVDDLVVTLVVETTGPVLESVRFPDLMVYGGAGESFMGYGEVRDQTLLVPGTRYTFRVDVALPEGGLWVPAGESLAVKVVPVMLQESASDILVLTGPRASRAEWVERPLGDAPRPAIVETTRGDLMGSAYAGEHAPESTRLATSVVVPEGARAFLAWMNTTSSQGIPDLDLELIGPDGSVVAFAGTPTPREALKLAAPNLKGAGEYQLVVTNYGSARASFDLSWTVG